MVWLMGIAAGVSALMLAYHLGWSHGFDKAVDICKLSKPTRTRTGHDLG